MRLGMFASRRFYALLNCFSERDRLILYEEGCKLAKENDILITVSKSIQFKYRLWVALSSDTDRNLLLETISSCRSKDADKFS